MLLTMLAGCVKEPEEKIVLDALARPMCRLADAVIEDGGPRSRGAAREVIAIYDAGGVDRPANHC